MLNEAGLLEKNTGESWLLGQDVVFVGVTCQAFEKFVIMCFRVTVDHSDLSISPDSDAVSLGLMVHKVRKYSYTWRFGPAPASQKIHLP